MRRSESETFWLLLYCLLLRRPPNSFEQACEVWCCDGCGKIGYQSLDYHNNCFLVDPPGLDGWWFITKVPDENGIISREGYHYCGRCSAAMIQGLPRTGTPPWTGHTNKQGRR